MSTTLHVKKTVITTKMAKTGAHPPVGRDPQVLMPESGNNSVSKEATKFPVNSLSGKNAIEPPWAN